MATALEQTEAEVVVRELLVAAATAHGVYEEQHLGGVHDQEWPQWYAAHIARALSDQGYRLEHGRILRRTARAEASPEMTKHSLIGDALRALVFDPVPDEPIAQTLDRYYSSDYTHRSDGRSMGRTDFAAMVEKIRGQAAGGAVTVLDELVDGPRYAERHEYRLTLKSGETYRREVTVFGALDADGRFLHLSETGFDLEPETPARRTAEEA